jgi:hypothetical protein
VTSLTGGGFLQVEKGIRCGGIGIGTFKNIALHHVFSNSQRGNRIDYVWEVKGGSFQYF